MIEEKKIKADELSAPAAGRIRELEIQVERLKRENRALQGKGKMLTTADVTAAPTISPRKNVMTSTTIQKPHLIGGRLLQTHNIQPKELDAAEILARVKGDRISVVTKKETKTK